MIIRLLPEQVNDYWELLFHYVKAAMPKHLRDHVKEASVLQAVFDERMQCWVSMIEEQVHAVITTSIVNDEHLGTKSLLIYSLVSVKLMPEEEWAQALRTISKFARGNGCANIIAYSDVPRVWEIAEMLGMDTKQRVISLEV
jgi:hypothetical protein